MNEWVLKTCQLSLLLPGMIPYFKHSPPSLNLQPLPSLSSSPQLQFFGLTYFSEEMEAKSSYNLLLPTLKPPSLGPALCFLPLCRASPPTVAWTYPLCLFGKNKPSPRPSPSGTQPLPFVPLHPLIPLAVLLKLLPSLKALPPSHVSPQPPFLLASQLSFSMASLRPSLSHYSIRTPMLRPPTTPILQIQSMFPSPLLDTSAVLTVFATAPRQFSLPLMFIAAPAPGFSPMALSTFHACP